VNKFFCIVLLIILDIISKKIVFYYLSLNSFKSILPVLDLTHIHNYGISFGLFAGTLSSWMIILFTSVITILIIYFLLQTSNNVEKWGLTLIIAGAISNIFDRLINNYVLDFIYLHYKDFYWPAFNFADIYITFGVMMILFQIFIEFKKKNVK
tara:strand:+ start:121 stop:579 length:459 start_codon:yes stop_codon:yes gene_type:complete